MRRKLYTLATGFNRLKTQDRSLFGSRSSRIVVVRTIGLDHNSIEQFELILVAKILQNTIINTKYTKEIAETKWLVV